MLKMLLLFAVIYYSCILGSSGERLLNDVISSTKSIEDMVNDYEDDKNSMIAVSHIDKYDLYEDFYDELDNWIKKENTMNIIFFGPPSSFLRLDPETILHILIYTKHHLIPISRVLLAWDIITDGKTAAYLQGREFLAFGNLLNVVPEEDLYYVNFGDPSVRYFFAKHSLKLYKRKIGVLVAAYRRYYGNDWYTNSSQINEIGYLLCGLPSTDLEKISPAIFKEINVDMMSKLDRCSTEQKDTIYKIAISPDAYGLPYKWTSYEIGRLSKLFMCIPKEQISSLQLEAITAITPDVMKLMNQNKLNYFTKQQVLRMTMKTRRIYILRMQLKNSLDMNQLARKYSVVVKPFIHLIFFNIVTLQYFVSSIR